MRKYISIHEPNASQPLQQEQFGHFCAGLIDADGHINKLGNIIIAFHEKDVSVAYGVKKRVCYGSVKQVKNKAACTFICSHTKGLALLGNLIQNRLMSISKIHQFNTRLVPKIRCQHTKRQNSQVCLNTHWLAGFIQGDGSFQIKLLRRNRRCEVRIVLQIDQKDDVLLKAIQAVVGGYVGFRKSQNTYYYSSVSFRNAVTLIEYLDKYQLMGNKRSQYWVWRKAYVCVQNQTHTSEKGHTLIKRLKETLSQLKKNYNKIC